MISIYVRNSVLSPSGYYRVEQYAKSMGRKHRVNNYTPSEIYRLCLKYKTKRFVIIFQALCFFIGYFRTLFFLLKDCATKPDAIIISREISPRFLPCSLYFLLTQISKHSKIFWDFDDDILLQREISKKEFQLLSAKSTKIIVVNQYLVKLIPEEHRHKALLMPTTDGSIPNCDLEKAIVKREKTLNDIVTILWLGTAVNLYHLEKILPALDKAAQRLQTIQNKKLQLRIVSSDFPSYMPHSLDIIKVNWSRQVAMHEQIAAHIGIMPLVDDEYSKGKGGFKLVQYMAVGLPVIASAVGYNNEIVRPSFGLLINDINDNEAWIKAIENLTSDAGKYAELCYNARKEWETNFSFNRNLSIWQNILENKQ